MFITLKGTLLYKTLAGILGAARDSQSFLLVLEEPARLERLSFLFRILGL
jgi:hypothetical protein